MDNLKAVTSYNALVGAVLIKLRADRNIKQSALANAVGVGGSTWSRIEKGESALTVEQLRSAASALNISPDRIVFLAEKVTEGLTKKGIKVASISTTEWSGIGEDSIQSGWLPVAGAALSGIVAGLLAPELSAG